MVSLCYYNFVFRVINYLVFIVVYNMEFNICCGIIINKEWVKEVLVWGFFSNFLRVECRDCFVKLEYLIKFIIDCFFVFREELIDMFVEVVVCCFNLSLFVSIYVIKEGLYCG